MKSNIERNEKKRSSDHISGGDSELGESGGDSDATVTGLPPRVSQGTINDRDSVSVDDGRSIQETNRSQRNVVSRRLNCSLHFLFFFFAGKYVLRT